VDDIDWNYTKTTKECVKSEIGVLKMNPMLMYSQNTKNKCGMNIITHMDCLINNTKLRGDINGQCGN
jgi:hypothetical protein